MLYIKIDTQINITGMKVERLLKTQQLKSSFLHHRSMQNTRFIENTLELNIGIKISGTNVYRPDQKSS